jgi:hypothetical protein
MLDWDANVNPEFAKTNKVFPKLVRTREEMNECGYSEQWVTYGTGWYSAKELTVFPGRTALITDASEYGLIVTQARSASHGSSRPWSNSKRTQKYA